MSSTLSPRIVASIVRGSYEILLSSLRTHVQKENITVLSLTPDVMRASSRISIFIVRKRKSDVVRNFLRRTDSLFSLHATHDFFYADHTTRSR